MSEPTEIQGQEQQQNPTEQPRSPIRQDQGGNFILIVDGEEKVLTPGEMAGAIGKVQKEYSADRKFNEAANMRKRQAELLRKSDQGDVDAYRALLSESGYSSQEVEAKATAYQQWWDAAAQYSENTEEEEVPEQEQQQQPRPIRTEDLPQDVRTELEEARASRHERVRQQVYAETEKALAADTILGKMVGKGGSRAEKLRGLAKKHVASRIRDGEEYGPKLLSEVVAELRDLAQEFGTTGPTPLPGLGHGPSLSHAETQAERPVQPLSPMDDGYKGNVAARMVRMCFNTD